MRKFSCKKIPPLIGFVKADSLIVVKISHKKYYIKSLFVKTSRLFMLSMSTKNHIPYHKGVNL